MGVDLNNTNNVGGFLSSMINSVIKSDNTQPRATAPLPNLQQTSSGGDFFIRMSLDLLQNSKEQRRNEPFRMAIKTALESLDRPQDANPLSVFKPFQLACQSGSSELIVIAIDCLGKLFTYNYWKFAAGIHVENQKQAKKKDEEEEGDADDNDGTSEMIAFVIGTICDSFTGESTDDKVLLQIIKALQAALTNSDPAFSLHGAILLKAIRTTYNIFLLSKSNDVQIVAQGTVTHMIQNVFSRIPNNKAVPARPKTTVHRQGSQSESLPRLNRESSESSASGGVLDDIKNKAIVNEPKSKSSDPALYCLLTSAEEDFHERSRMPSKYFVHYVFWPSSRFLHQREQ